MQPNRLRRQQFREFIAPLGDDHAALIEQFIPAQRDQFCRRFQPIEIQVKHRQAAAGVFVEQPEGRARDIGRGAYPGDESLGPVGFPSAESADEGDHGARPCQIRRLPAEGFHRFGTFRVSLHQSFGKRKLRTKSI